MLSGRRLYELLSFDYQTGHFYWRVQKGRARAGDRAGALGIQNKYWQIRIDSKLYNAHVLVWLYVTGVYPTVTVDHRDGDGLNNRFHNLRLATYSQSTQNTKTRIDNKSGCRGVCWYKAYKKWIVTIRVEKKSIFLGYYEDYNEAVTVRTNAAKQLFGEFYADR